jgi:hypothetical protein
MHCRADIPVLLSLLLYHPHTRRHRCCLVIANFDRLPDEARRHLKQNTDKARESFFQSMKVKVHQLSFRFSDTDGMERIMRPLQDSTGGMLKTWEKKMKQIGRWKRQIK